jgi:hypothetical protein
MERLKGERKCKLMDRCCYNYRNSFWISSDLSHEKFIFLVLSQFLMDYKLLFSYIIFVICHEKFSLLRILLSNLSSISYSLIVGAQVRKEMNSYNLGKCWSTFS